MDGGPRFRHFDGALIRLHQPQGTPHVAADTWPRHHPAGGAPGHGEQDIRVHPKQSEELVAELRRLGGKTFEYVTYTTEGHGLLRFEPQVDFYRRLERFFDWYLM